MKQVVLILGSAVMGSSVSNMIGNMILFSPEQQAMVSSVITSIVLFTVMEKLKN